MVIIIYECNLIVTVIHSVHDIVMAGYEHNHFLFLLFPQITELAGYTSRVSEMLQVFEDVQQGKYHMTGTVTDQSRAVGMSVCLFPFGSFVTWGVTMFEL